MEKFHFLLGKILADHNDNDFYRGSKIKLWDLPSMEKENEEVSYTLEPQILPVENKAEYQRKQEGN